MQVTVELFGIPRARAGVSQAVAEGATLGDVLLDLTRRYPALGDTCVEGYRLRPGFVANLRGERFVTDPATELTEGDAILLLSQDAGG
jgi:molybdopterin converting factor small subunit